MTEGVENIGRKENSYQASPRGWGLETIRQGREKIRPWAVVTTVCALSPDPCDSGIAPLKDGEALGVGRRTEKQACSRAWPWVLCVPKANVALSGDIFLVGHLREACAIAI